MVHPSFLAEAHELLNSPISEEDLTSEAMALPAESAPGEDADEDPLREKK
jgi:hypothetical protein